MSDKVECAVCMKEVELLEKFNGEMMCQDCYHDEDNNVFGDGKDGE